MKRERKSTLPACAPHKGTKWQIYRRARHCSIRLRRCLAAGHYLGDDARQPRFGEASAHGLRSTQEINRGDQPRHWNRAAVNAPQIVRQRLLSSAWCGGDAAQLLCGYLNGQPGQDVGGRRTGARVIRFPQADDGEPEKHLAGRGFQTWKELVALAGRVEGQGTKAVNWRPRSNCPTAERNQAWFCVPRFRPRVLCTGDVEPAIDEVGDIVQVQQDPFAYRRSCPRPTSCVPSGWLGLACVSGLGREAAKLLKGVWWPGNGSAAPIDRTTPIVGQKRSRQSPKEGKGR